MSQMKLKSIAVICNYEINENRIGGMDRFFKAFDTQAKKEGYTVHWFFKGHEMFDFYKGLDIVFSKAESVESLFLSHLKNKMTAYTYVITHFVELCSPFYKEAKLKTNAYCIAVDHNPRPLEGFPVKKRLKLKIKGLIYGRYIDSFIGVSKYTAEHILKDYGNFLKPKVHVIYNGIDTSLFKKREIANTNRFIVASHLRPSKGIQDLLKALSLVPHKLKSNMLVDIYGEGPIENELRQNCTELGLDSVVTFKGSSSQLHCLFCNYSYMIQPTYMECFSLSILESLSANVPVITTQVGGNMEVIEDGVNGYIFQAGDISELKTIFSEILTGERAIISTVDENIKKNYSIERMVREHIKLLV